VLGIRVPSHLQSLLESLPPDAADMKDTVVEVHSNENHLPVPHNQSFTTQTPLRASKPWTDKQLMSKTTQEDLFS
jgi:NADPH-dependent ferric siderophore reductase